MLHENEGRATPVVEGTMFAVVTTGTGGYDRLQYRRVPVPSPGPGEVLLSVLGAGVNNTDINRRLGWYSGSVRGGTDATTADADREDGFPALVWYIEKGEIQPLLAATYPLKQIAEAQRAFQDKRHIGKIVLVPPSSLRSSADISMESAEGIFAS
jgi:NADPH:quinone reductase-like Zn-dependent oxidoreductase